MAITNLSLHSPGLGPSLQPGFPLGGNTAFPLTYTLRLSGHVLKGLIQNLKPNPNPTINPKPNPKPKTYPNIISNPNPS